MSTPSHDVREEREGLMTLAASPMVWVAHFLLSYCTAAVWCAKVADAGDSLTPVRLWIGGYTVLALLAIAFFGWRGWKRHMSGRMDEPHRGDPRRDPSAPHEIDTPEDRHRFLGFATALLSGLSAVAVVYETLPALFIWTCR